MDEMGDGPTLIPVTIDDIVCCAPTGYLAFAQRLAVASSTAVPY